MVTISTELHFEGIYNLLRGEKKTDPKTVEGQKELMCIFFLKYRSSK